MGDVVDLKLASLIDDSENSSATCAVYLRRHRDRKGHLVRNTDLTKLPWEITQTTMSWCARLEIDNSTRRIKDGSAKRENVRRNLVCGRP